MLVGASGVGVFLFAADLDRSPVYPPYADAAIRIR
jgi:hypothetical protein